MKYDYLLVDAQLVLTRNFHRLRHQYLTKGGLIKSFLQSIVKLVREVPTKEIYLIWDRSPYFRHQMLEDYKGDRKYYTDEDLKDPTLTDEEKRKIEKDIKEFRLRNEVKYYIINNSDKLGMPSLIQQGFEADDIAFIGCRSLKGKICIASSDSDWKYLLIENCDHYNLKNKVTSYEEISTECGMDPYLWKSITDSLYGSHNFLQNVSNIAIGVPEVLNYLSIDNYDFTSDKDRFLSQLKSFDVKSFSGYDYLCNKVSNMSTDFTKVFSDSEFSQFTIDNHINIKTNYFTDHINRLNHV